jgi:hypothetical protein
VNVFFFVVEIAMMRLQRNAASTAVNLIGTTAPPPPPPPPPSLFATWAPKNIIKKILWGTSQDAGLRDDSAEHHRHQTFSKILARGATVHELCCTPIK